MSEWNDARWLGVHFRGWMNIFPGCGKNELKRCEGYDSKELQTLVKTSRIVQACHQLWRNFWQSRNHPKFTCQTFVEFRQPQFETVWREGNKKVIILSGSKVLWQSVGFEKEYQQGWELNCRRDSLTARKIPRCHLPLLHHAHPQERVRLGPKLVPRIRTWSCYNLISFIKKQYT